MIRNLFLSRLAACCLLPWFTAGCVFDTAGLSPVTPDPFCGDGVIQAIDGEDCEGPDLNDFTCQTRGYYGGTLACRADCTFDVSACEGPPPCGNGEINPEEDCDGDNLNQTTCLALGYDGGTLVCDTDCTFDVSSCEGTPPCGNGVIDQGEDCDGDELGNETCESLGLGVGDLACNVMCAYDLGGCYAPVCGDGSVDGDEVCDDDGTDECSGTCNADCTGPANACGDGIVRCDEECETLDLQGSDCTAFGYADPAGLACSGLCAFDTSGCHSDCGNGVLDPGETCEDGNTNAANATDDFCGPLCTTNTWACAGAWPGYLPPSNTDETWVTFTNTSLAGSTTGYATGAAGSPVNISGSYAYNTVASGCPGCIVQLYWGFFAGDPPASDADANAGFKFCQDDVNATPNDTYNFTLNLPTQPGTYYLRWGRSWEYSCNYNLGAPDAGRSLAVICVY
ncbi:hypothetical protein KJ975_05145 [Myxococcota bacterium]|nr:hypothetical protein [Myxococcota bacterium]